MNLYGAPEISVEALHDLRTQALPHRLLDVREESEWHLARIEGAELLPLSRLARELEAALPANLDKDSTIVVVCHHGVRSAQVTAWMSQQGYTGVYSLDGGIEAWSQRIDPHVPRY